MILGSAKMLDPGRGMTPLPGRRFHLLNMVML
jgi:hypothetical protein